LFFVTLVAVVIPSFRGPASSESSSEPTPWPRSAHRAGAGGSLATICCGTISVTWRTVGLIRVTGLKGLGTFTGFGVFRRFRWASVVGRAFSRVMPCDCERVAGGAGPLARLQAAREDEPDPQHPGPPASFRAPLLRPIRGHPGAAGRRIAF